MSNARVPHLTLDSGNVKGNNPYLLSRTMVDPAFKATATYDLNNISGYSATGEVIYNNSANNPFTPTKDTATNMFDNLKRPANGQLQAANNNPCLGQLHTVNHTPSLNPNLSLSPSQSPSQNQNQSLGQSHSVNHTLSPRPNLGPSPSPSPSPNLGQSHENFVGKNIKKTKSKKDRLYQKGLSRHLAQLNSLLGNMVDTENDIIQKPQIGEDRVPDWKQAFSPHGGTGAVPHLAKLTEERYNSIMGEARY